MNVAPVGDRSRWSGLQQRMLGIA